MIKSMTGYGKGDCTQYNRKFTVEIKSVNHRYNDINIKMPRMMSAFEDKIRATLNNEISRGKVDVYINYDSYSQDDITINLNEALADAYVQKLTQLKERYHLSDAISLSLIARFPDVVNVEKNIDNEQLLNQMWETSEQALQSAITHFVEMRCREGAALKADILDKNSILRKYTDDVKSRSPHVVNEYHKRLNHRIREAIDGVELDESRLVNEIAIFADKTCIDEELTRLYSHMNQLEFFLEEKEPIGKKLDFLVQEMNREVNTIGSKSNDVEITKLVIEMKSEIEKIREQVQNIE